MKAMIFAAGEGRRMRPLTLATPKPLLRVEHKSLLEHLIIKLHDAGIDEIVVNVSYLAEQIRNELKLIDLKGMTCHLSLENTLLETGGALKYALSHFDSEPFLVVNSDVWCDVDLGSFMASSLSDDRLAHLLMVPCPEHNANGDFLLDDNGFVCLKGNEPLAETCTPYTFAGISMIHPELIRHYAPERLIFPFRDLLFPAINNKCVTGSLYKGYWLDVGTPTRLDELREYVAFNSLNT